MFDEQDRQYFYNEFKNNGYEVGSYDDFKKDLNNEEDRNWYYNEAKNMGYDVGTQADFDKMVLEPAPSTSSSGGKQVNASKEAKPQVQPSSSNERGLISDILHVKNESLGDAVKDFGSDFVDKLKEMPGKMISTVSGLFGGDSQPQETVQPSVNKNQPQSTVQQDSPESKEAAPVTTPTGVVNNEGLMDAKLANYLENWKQRPDKQSTYFENLVADLLADGTANSNEEAVNMVMPALHRYANRSAMDVTNQVVSSLPDDTVQDAEKSIEAQWYSHGVQDKLKQEAYNMGISYDDYVGLFLKPAMVQSLVNKYGPKYRDIAEGIATRLYSHDENVQDRLMNQDINDALSSVISKYVNPSVVDEYNKAQEAGSKAFTEGMEGSQFIPANLRLGTALGAQYEANEAKDPAKVLSSLQKKFGRLYRNPQFLNDMSNAAFKVMQRYGLNGTQSSDPKQFKPMINSVLKNELDQLEIKGMMPKGSAEYIMKTGLGNTIVGKITRKAVQTDYQNWLEDIANQQYQPGFWENVASGALTFAGDAWSYWLPGAAGGKLTKSMVAKAEGKLAGDLMAKGMERKMAERAAKVLIGKSKAAALKSGAAHGAVTFGGQSAISKPIDETYRTGQFDENGKIYNPSVGKVIANTLGEVAKQSAVGAIMQGGTIANMVGKGRGLATNILADIGGKVVDSGIMTGQQLLERMAHDPNFKPTGKDAAETFLESGANLLSIGFPGFVGKYARFKDAREFNKKFDFTDQDIAELKRFGYDGLRDAFEKVGIGEYAVVGENAQRLDGQLTQKYMDLMNDKSVPEVLKAKMMAVVEGKRPSSFSPVIDSEVYRGDDGKYYLETYNKDGGVIDRKEYSSHDAARNDEKKLEYEKTLGLASVLEGEFHNDFTQEHLDGLYNKAAQKYNMGEKLTDEDKAAVYLHQNAGAIKEIMDKQQKGVILTDEEQKQVNAYRHYYDNALENSSVMREFVNTFEDSHGVARGTLRKALESKDKKYAPLVESYLKELYNSIELKREMKQTMDDPYNTSHGNEQKRIEQSGIEGEKPSAPVEGAAPIEGSAGGQEPPVSAGPAPYQDRTNSVPSPSDANSAANVANSSAEVAASDAFVMGQNAYKNGDSEALQAIDYNSDLATGRLKRGFADNEKMPDIVANAYNEGRDMEQFVAQRAGSLTPAQKDAINKYVEAMDAKKGAIDALQHADDGYGDALKEQLWPYQTEDGNIVPATLDSGKQVFLKKANEYGGAFVVVPDEQGQPTIKQVSAAEIVEVGTPVPLDEYIENAVAQQKDARAQQFISQFDGSGLKPNDHVTVAMEQGDENIDMTFAGYSEDGKIVLTDGKDYLPLSKEEFAAWRKNALDNTINEHLVAEDVEREQAQIKKAEADKQERYKKGIFGYAAGQPDYSDTQTDPKVAAEYLQETAGEDRKGLFSNIVAEKQALQKRINQLREHIANNEEWLSINADLDPKNAETRSLANKQMKGQIADLQARFDNWNKIRSAVMTPEEAEAIKADRTKKIADAGVNEGEVTPIEGREIAVLSDEELKKQYPTMDEASSYITSERKRIYRLQSDEVQREINGVDEVLERYVNGEIDLEPEQLKELNTTKAQLQARQANLTESAKDLKAQADKLKTLYRKENMEARAKAMENMTPAEQRAVKVENAIKNGDLSQLNSIYEEVRGATDFTDTEPNTIEEYVANNIGRFSLNYEGKDKAGVLSNGIKQETGLGRKDFDKLQILAKEGEGKTVPEFVHSLYDNMPEQLKQMGYSDQDIRDAFLNLIGSAENYSDLKNYTLNNKVAEAEQSMRDIERQEEEMKENSAHSEAFDKIVELAKEQKDYWNLMEQGEVEPDDVPEVDVAYDMDELLKTLSDEEFKEVSDVLKGIDEEFEYFTADEYERRELADERKKKAENAKTYDESIKQALKPVTPFAYALKSAVESGDKKAIKKAQKELTDALIASDLGHDYLSGQLAQAKLTKKKDELYKVKRATIKPLTDAIRAIENGENIVNAPFADRLQNAIAETETEPTEAQKKAGNYKKGHLSFGGYDFTVETPKGVTRSGKDEQGKPWSVTMHDTYGYILGKIGVDGDHIDMFINDAADLDTFDGNVYVVDQVNPETGEFDEHKVMYGYPSEEAATEAYLANYSKDWKGLGKVTSVPKSTFDKWLESSDRKTKPFAEYAMIQQEEAKKANQTNEALPFDAPMSMDDLPFHRDVKEVKPENLTEAQKVAYDAVSTMLKKAGIPVKVVSNEYMEKVAEAQDNLAVEMLLNDPRLRFYIKTPEQKEAAKAAYDWAAKNRPDKFKQYAIVNMDNPNQPPQYFEKKALAEKWRKYYTNAWKIGNYKAFNLNKPFEEQIKDVKGDVPNEFDPYKAESLLNKRIELEKQIKETEDSYNAKKKERAEYQNQLMQDYMDQHGLSSENDIPDDVWTDYRDKSFEKYQDTLDDLFHKYVELDNQLKAVAEPGVQYLKGKGVVYGYTDGKQIVLNQEHLNPNTPIHEYQHLWRTAAKNMNPELIEHGDKLIMQTQLFADLKKDPNYKHLSDDEICDEAFARLTGEDGEAILEQMAKDAIKENPLDTAKELSVINKLKEWLKKFWYWTLETFTKWKPEDIKKMTLEDIRNLVLRDLANGVDPRKKSRLANEDAVKVSPEIAKTPVNVVNAEAKHGFKNYAEAREWAKKNIVRTYNNEETGGKGEINISNTAVGKYLSEKAVKKTANKDVHMSVLKVLPSVLRESIDAIQHVDRNKVGNERSEDFGINPDVIIHRCYGAVNIGDKVYGVKITLKENVRTHEKTKLYSYEATKIELLDGQSGDVAMTSPRNSNNSITVAKIIKGFETTKKNGEKVDSESTKFSLKDEEYLKAVEDGNMEKAQKMVNEAADAAGYSTDSSYQGTSAFNGAAPWGNGYFLTKDERKEAWDNGEFEGESTLGDYINDDIDGGNLEELTNAASYRAADPMRKEAIDNVRNVIQKKAKTITMYRSVPSDVKEGSFRNGDWVTPSRAYAVDNAKLHGWGDDYNIIEQKVPVDDVWFDGNDIAEWGYGREEDYINDTDFAYKNSKNNKKLLDAVTYDDNGNVIPLSQRFNEKNKDVRFSLEDPKTLAGVHNISEDKLLKAIKQGGLANPSVAVIDTSKQNHESYGDISLILPSDMVAKKTGKNAGTWQGDAYTPTYPQVEKHISNKGSEQVNKDVLSVPKEIQHEVRNGIYRWLDGDTNSGLKYLFLHEKGKAPKMVELQHKYSDKVYNDLKSITAGDFDISSIGKADTEKVLSMYIDNVFGGDRDAYDEKQKYRILRYKKQVADGEKNPFLLARAKNALEQYDKYGFYFDKVQDFVRKVERDHRMTGVNTDATLNEVEDYIKTNNLTDEFNTWLEGKEKEYGIKEVIFDGFTPSGNRRYVPNTLENASKIMKKQGRNGATGTSVSFQNFAARLMPSYGTLKDIRSKKGLLTSDREKFDNFREKWSNVFFELGMKCQPDATGTFDDYGLARLSEAAMTSDPQAYLKKEYNVDFSDEDTKRLKEMVKAIKEEHPAMYFETKFERPVGFNEFSSAVVPTTASNEVKQALQNAGVQIYEYDKEKEGDRKRAFNEAINSNNEIRFHRVTEVKSSIVEQKLKKHPDSLMKAGTYFSGGGLVEEGLKGIIDPVVAVEYDRKISGVYRNNFGQHIVTADVRDVDPKELVKQIDGDVEYFHASPVCKNYSQAKSNSGEVELDKETAKSTADFIDAVKPRVVTIENVKGYKDSEAMKIITQALDKNGYTWDSDVYNAADYGGYTSRERLIVRAVKDGELPEKPKKQPRKGGWLEAVEDILPTLTVKESGVAPWMDARLKADGIDWQKVEKPLYVMGSAYADGKIPHAYGDEILPTLRTKSGDVIIMPGGKVLRADGRVLARITGLGDDYKLPKTESLAHTIIGNGIPVQLTKGVIAPLLNKDDLSGRNVLARLGSSIFKNNWDADKQKQVSDRVVNTANKLGGAEATVYTSVDEVPDAYLSDVKNGATGWYDPTTHTVHVYLPNCADANEAERTVLHEKIGHEGMEVLLGGEDGVRKFANFVYNSVAASTRGKILDNTNKYDPDWKNPDRMNVGTQEYIAHLAEEGPKTAEDFTLWTKIKHYLIKVLKKLGVRVPGLLNDKDLRYYLMKAGKALHVWDEMPQEKQEAMMKQASNAEIKDALSDGAGKGKPRQKKGESTIQYMKRVQEWRKWQNAREDKENPEPPMFYDIDKDEAGKKEWAQLNKDWRERHHLVGEEPTGMPIRMENEEDDAYMNRIHEYEKWQAAMKDQVDPLPDMFAFEKKKQEEVKRKYEDWLAKHDLLEQQQADLDLYEGKIYPAETNPKADALEKQVMQDLAEVTSTDVSKEGAAKTVKHAVIHRRKNMEEASAYDAIYINDVKNRIVKMADSGAFDKLLSEYQGKPNRAEKLAEAIPYIIEAPRRLRDLARDLNATGAFDKGHIHIQPADVEAIQPYVTDLIAETGKKHTELKDGKEVEVYDDPQAVSEVASKMAQAINANHQGEEGFVPIDGTDILSEHVLPLVKQQIVPKGIDYKNISPDMKNTVRSIRDWYDYFYDWLKDNRTLREDTGYNVDYVNHIWDKEKSDPNAYATFVENRQRTKSPNEKPRTISTLMEGISVGLVPKTTDITKMMAYYSRSNIEAWVNKTMLQELSGLNVIERNEDGEVVSTDPLLSSSAPFNLEQYQYFEIPGVGPVWVYNVSPKQVKVKNPITGKEKVLYSEASAGDRFGVVFETYQSSPFWKAFDTLASSAKKLELGFSGFHAGALTEVYMVQNMVEFGPKKAMANFMKYIFVDTAKNHELPCFANPEDFQEAASHLVKFGATNDYAAADVQNMFDNMRDAMIKVQKKLKDGNKISGTVAKASMPLKVATQMLSLINKGMDVALWDFLHDGLKLATYRMRADKTKERAKKKGWTEEELSRALDEDGQFVNDMFGGQHWDVLGASHRTLRYAGRVLLSPDWNASTTRHFLALTGFGSIWNEATFENFKQYYKRLKHKELTPEDEGRRSRQISALLCYGIGFMVFYEGIANGINAAFRALDEEKERKKAEEMRKTNPNYRSMYELAYGDEGMKWYDYLMRGNSLGQQSKIFLGRYEDGTEMYVRHGKQFREVPEYLFNHKGELEFPGPMVQRMIGKANPMVRMTLDDINYLSDFQASHADQEIQRKYGKTIGLLYKDALYWAPFLIPSQENKEFKAVDFFFPSSKGFSPWKAQSYFKDFILSGDMEGVVMTYQSCQRNGIDPEAQIKAAIGSVKALESAEMSDGVTSLQEASKRFDAAKSITEKKKMRQKMKKFLSQSDYKAFTQKEALDMVQGYLNGDEDLKEMEKAESKYLMKAKAEDVTEDWRIQNVWNGTMETYQEYQRLKDVDKAKANAFKNSKTNKRLFAARKAISAARRKMNKVKKQMDGTNDAAKLVEIRNTRKELLEKLNGME